MRAPGRCPSCGQDTMVVDDDSGILVCGVCGRVEIQAEADYQTDYLGGKATHISSVQGRMRGQVSVQSNDDRSSNARDRDFVNCDPIDLGPKYERTLAERLGTKLPEGDAYVFLEHATATLPALNKVSKEVIHKIISQSTILLKCAEEWSISTGQWSLPVVAAVLALVMEANEVDVEIGKVASGLNAGLSTTNKYFNEFKEALVGSGQHLPWGKDLTLKTVLRHFPFLIMYLELKMNIAGNGKEKVPSSRLLCSTIERVCSSGADSWDGKIPPTDVLHSSAASSGSHLIHSGRNQWNTASAKAQPPSPSAQAFGNDLPGARECRRAVGDTDGGGRFPIISCNHDLKRKSTHVDQCVPSLQFRQEKIWKVEAAYNASKHNVLETNYPDQSNATWQ